MPIGKNAIKRISNNGYSNVKTSAPDMENSEVSAEKIAVVEKKEPSAKKSTTKKASVPKKVTPKKTTEPKIVPKKSMEKEPDIAPVKTLEKVIKKPAKASKTQERGYIKIGEELPIYLL